MSALGQKQTCAAQKVMSALPPKADMCGATRDVRFVPIADIGHALKCNSEGANGASIFASRKYGRQIGGPFASPSGVVDTKMRRRRQP